eukprot:212712-Pelagomonas_calceolata.AAC.3
MCKHGNGAIATLEHSSQVAARNPGFLTCGSHLANSRCTGKDVKLAESMQNTYYHSTITNSQSKSQIQRNDHTHPICADGDTQDGKYATYKPRLVLDVIALPGEIPDGQGQRQESQAADDPPKLQHAVEEGKNVPPFTLQPTGVPNTRACLSSE